LGRGPCNQRSMYGAWYYGEDDAHPAVWLSRDDHRALTRGDQAEVTEDGMPSCKAVALLMAWLSLTSNSVSLGTAGEPRTALLKQYWGKITSVRVDKCGKRPGLCEGMIILARRDGGQLALAIRPGTWIKRGDRLILLEELRVGEDVHVQAIEIPEEGAMRATTIDTSTNP
jgi:hypothetical protein